MLSHFLQTQAKIAPKGTHLKNNKNLSQLKWNGSHSGTTEWSLSMTSLSVMDLLGPEKCPE